MDSKQIEEILKPEYERFFAHFEIGNYREAARVFLGTIQIMQPHPVAYLDYQNASFEHFFSELARGPYPLNFEAYEFLLRRFLAAALQGYLPDMRIPSN